MRRLVFFLGTFLALILLWAPAAWEGEKIPANPSPKDRCPVCGMFVHKYPDFIARIIFKGGSVVYFDGAKDMFKYYLEIQKFDPKRKQADIDSASVTDYYSLVLIDGRKALYVLGSDVYGPMGAELIPFEKAAEAQGFMQDHKGKRLLRFEDVTRSIVKGLD